MEEITTNKAREKKLQLETYFKDAIEDFEESTGCTVVDMKVNRSFKSDADAKQQNVHATNFHGVSISVEL